MIYVFDNKVEYSGHALYFFELPDEVPEAEAIWLIENSPTYRAQHERDERGMVVAKAEKLTWFAGGTSRVICWLCSLSRLSACSKADRDWLLRCPAKLLEATIAAQEAMNRDYIAGLEKELDASQTRGKLSKAAKEHSHIVRARMYAGVQEQVDKASEYRDWLAAGKPESRIVVVNSSEQE